MTTYYYDPSAAPGGNGLSQATAFDSLSDLPNGAGHTHLFRADGLRHLWASIPAVNPSAAITGKTLGGNTNYGTYGAGAAVLTGAVRWTGAETPTLVNGISCVQLQHSAAVDPFWFPVVSDRRAYPCRCAPTADDAVDSFMTNPAALDDILPDARGVRFVPAANYGGTTDATKEASYVDRGAGWVPSTARYLIKLKAPGFWARANAVVSIVGRNVVTRTGANFTNYFPTIESYDAVEGAVYVASNQAPSNGTQGLFFYALVAHPYGLRTPRQYAMLPNNMGWVANLPEGDIEIACYSTIFKTVSDNVLFSTSSTWEFQACAHGNTGAGGGSGVYIEQGVSGFTIGDVVARNICEYSRSGAPIRIAGSGDQINISVQALRLYDCLGIKAYEFAPTGVNSGQATATGPIYSDSGGGGLRIAGYGAGPVLVQDFVITPRASVHDNHVNIYERVKSVTMKDGVLAGAQNPIALQWNDNGGTIPPPADVNRQLINIWASGLTNLDGTISTNSILRNDDGSRGSLFKRVISVYGGSTSFGSGAGSEPNDGTLVDRCILENLSRSSPSDAATFTGMTFRHCVFAHKPAVAAGYPTVQAYVEAFGGTVENCVEDANLFAGYLTDDMWKKLTLNDTYDGYVDVPWLAPQLGLTLKAYGSPRLLRAPAFVHMPFRVGHQAGLIYGTFINQNPLATMSLPAGLGDNDKLRSTLYGGINCLAGEDCPDQPTFTIVLRVTDAGAANGPYQDFSYVIPIERFLSPSTVYGPFTLSVTDGRSREAALPAFYISVAT